MCFPNLCRFSATAVIDEMLLQTGFFEMDLPKSRFNDFSVIYNFQNLTIIHFIANKNQL